MSRDKYYWLSSSRDKEYEKYPRFVKKMCNTYIKQLEEVLVETGKQEAADELIDLVIEHSDDVREYKAMDKTDYKRLLVKVATFEYDLYRSDASHLMSIYETCQPQVKSEFAQQMRHRIEMVSSVQRVKITFSDWFLPIELDLDKKFLQKLIMGYLSMPVTPLHITAVEIPPSTTDIFFGVNDVFGLDITERDVYSDRADVDVTSSLYFMEEEMGMAAIKWFSKNRFGYSNLIKSYDIVMELVPYALYMIRQLEPFKQMESDWKQVLAFYVHCRITKWLNLVLVLSNDFSLSFICQEFVNIEFLLLFLQYTSSLKMGGKRVGGPQRSARRYRNT